MTLPSSNPSPRQRSDAPPPATSVRQVVLVKQGRRFVFHFEPGEEAQVLAQVSDLARDPASGLSWLDAAHISHQIGQSLRQRIEPSQT